ncbi:MAG: CinA family protein, partial [Oscillospiraceae bacterium]|nr:CinA family protein [Oscillospiraceae bacterium]
GNPVGTVFIGLATPEGTLCRAFAFGKRSRARIRGHAANSAFDLVRRYLQGKLPPI